MQPEWYVCRHNGSVLTWPRPPPCRELGQALMQVHDMLRRTARGTSYSTRWQPTHPPMVRRDTARAPHIKRHDLQVMSHAKELRQLTRQCTNRLAGHIHPQPQLPACPLLLTAWLAQTQA